MKNDILDLIKPSISTEEIFSIIYWWERHRLGYTITLIITEIAMLMIFWSGTLAWGIPQVILWSLAYLLLANILFSIGWGGEILCLYYLKKNYLKNYRNLFFIAGILFSVFLTISWFMQSLYYYKIINF